MAPQSEPWAEPWPDKGAFLVVDVIRRPGWWTLRQNLDDKSHRFVLCVVGIAAVVVIECVALMNGTDGVAISASSAAIGAIVGFLARGKGGRA